MNNFSPRPSQQNILQYNGGRLGIAAVPGAGKTHILSALAAQIIRDNKLQDGQEVLIVTLVNSAVDNFENRIKGFFENKLTALYKYRVRTLHGLAHDIVREKPASVGLDERFSIIDEREANFIRRESVNAWLASNSLDDYLDPALDSSKLDWVKRSQLPDLVDSLALAFIRSAKDRLLTPESLRAKLDSSLSPLPLAELGYSIYADYQRALAYRGAVDFDDLIRLALILLQSDDEFLERLRFRYPFILEDEAQDSSLSQQKILSLLSGESSSPDSGREGGGEGETLYASYGVMGGFMQPQGHVQVLSALKDGGLDQQSTLDLPRFCIDVEESGGRVAIEEGMPKKTMDALQKMGHPLYEVSGYERAMFGRGQVILRDENTKVLIGGSDPRADGYAGSL
ncbi:MAG: UvrD-helicase domain-containing protein [Anaerolineales bacterium]